MMTSSSQAVAVRSEGIATCMTCPICNKLFKNATTITECLHTFCRKCIYGKIAEEGLGNCPECKVYLGCAPSKKLRADHSVQDFKAAIFDSSNRRDPNPLLTTIESMEPEVMPTSPLLSRSKERSLSSLNFCAGESSKQNVPCECAKALLSHWKVMISVCRDTALLFGPVETE
ncbi:E3 ubiquitin protein ligase DRIP2 [Camellia lanceoleosa]|uniref:E3 ubiquitin protein ligase DRIP2 n=1 Tax=Camellia lanceoleosa TaxID=1840588 RepID=A0ACC0GQ03_9ERIC|nr:E3 ubiquitin protein ligase DRIP2 [Camellia lanceoleosa]